MFDQFHQFASLPPSFASYFVTRIPKIKFPYVYGEFKPIFLVGSLYKPVAKVLDIRHGSVMDKLVSPNPLAFLNVRMLMDFVVAIIGVVDLAKKSKRAFLILKIDFEKAYDSTS